MPGHFDQPSSYPDSDIKSKKKGGFKPALLKLVEAAGQCKDRLYRFPLG
jgi:hypothetical protein